MAINLNLGPQPFKRKAGASLRGKDLKPPEVPKEDVEDEIVVAPYLDEDHIDASERSENGQKTTRERSENGQKTTRERSENGQMKFEAHNLASENDQKTIRKRSDKPTENGQIKSVERSENGQKTVRKKKSDKYSYTSLVGLQKQLVDYYYNSIQSGGGNVTHEIRSIDLQELTGWDTRTIIDANYQLTKKGIIQRADYKDGRAGWTKFSIDQSIKEEIYRLLMVRERSENDQKTVRKRPAERSDAGSSSSSLNSSSFSSDVISPLTSSTTTTGQNAISRELEWVADVDIPPQLTQWITSSHLRQLVRFGFSRTELPAVQASLDNLAFAIDIGHKYKNPAGLFLAAMKRDGFVSPVENHDFNRARTMKLLEEDKAALEEALKREIERRTLEKMNTSVGSLDDIPF